MHSQDSIFDNGFIQVDKIHKIYYEQYGNPEGKVILFLHGFPELSYSYRYLLKNFSNEGYYCIAPDQRGYGKTLGGSKKFEHNFPCLLILCRTI